MQAEFVQKGCDVTANGAQLHDLLLSDLVRRLPLHQGSQHLRLSAGELRQLAGGRRGRALAQSAPCSTPVQTSKVTEDLRGTASGFIDF